MHDDIDVTMSPTEAVRRIGRLAGMLSDDDLALLADACQVRDVAAGETVVAEGTSTDALLLVVDGELDVYTDTGGGERKLGHVGPGSFLGEVSLMDPGPATASVVTDEGCTVLRLERGRLEQLIREHPSVATTLLRDLNATLAQRVADATARLAGLGGPDAQELHAAPVEELIGVHGALYSGGGDT